jgi:DNA-binding MarR family transcriptional regulator
MIEDMILRQPGHAIRRAHQHAWSAFMECTKAYDITPVQYSLMVVVNEFPGIDASRLSEIISIDRATVGNIVQRLQTKGFLMRRPDPSDARAKNIYITPDGETLLHEVSLLRPAIADRVLENLSPDERTALMQLLNKLVGLAGVEERVSNYREADRSAKAAFKKLARAR